MTFSNVAATTRQGIIDCTGSEFRRPGPLVPSSWQVSLSCVGEACRLFSNHCEGEAMDYRFRIFEGADGQTYVTIQHANGQTLYTSEGYTTKQAAVDTLENFLDAIRSVSLNFADGKLLVARYSVSSTEVQS